MNLWLPWVFSALFLFPCICVAKRTSHLYPARVTTRDPGLDIVGTNPSIRVYVRNLSEQKQNVQVSLRSERVLNDVHRPKTLSGGALSPNGTWVAAADQHYTNETAVTRTSPAKSIELQPYEANSLEFSTQCSWKRDEMICTADPAVTARPSSEFKGAVTAWYDVRLLIEVAQDQGAVVANADISISAWPGRIDDKFLFRAFFNGGRPL